MRLSRPFCSLLYLLAEVLMWVQVLLERVVLVYVMAKQEPFVEGKFTCVPYTVLYKVSKRFHMYKPVAFLH